MRHGRHTKTPAAIHMVTISEETIREECATISARCGTTLNLFKRTRQDMQNAGKFVCNRLKDPDEHDYKILPT